MRKAEEDYPLLIGSPSAEKALAEINQLRTEIETLERRNEHQRRMIDDTIVVRKQYDLLALEFQQIRRSRR